MGQIQTAPATDSAGGGAASLSNLSAVAAVTNGNWNYQGWGFTPYRDVLIHGVNQLIDSVAGDYRACIAPFNQGSGLLTGAPAFGDTVTPGALTRANIYMPFADPVTLAAGQLYFIGGGVFTTGNAPSTNVYISTGTNAAGHSMPGITQIPQTKVIQVAAPVNGSAIAQITNGQLSGGIFFSLPS